jgi:hypothetical protein
MATISRDERANKNFWDTFSPSEHETMLKDDLRAALTVTMILTGVLFSGLVIGLVGVTLSL